MLKGITSKIHDLNAIFLLINKYLIRIRRMLQIVYIQYIHGNITVLKYIHTLIYKLNIILRIQCR